MAGGGPDRKRRPGLGNAARAMQGATPWIGAVWRFIGGAVVGLLGGYWIDRWLGTGPWGMVALATLGIGVGFYGFIHGVLKLQKGRE